MSLTGGGRGGRDPRVTISLKQQFRAFAGTVACAVVSMDLQPRVNWETVWPLRALLDDDVMVGGGGGDVSERNRRHARWDGDKTGSAGEGVVHTSVYDARAIG